MRSTRRRLASGLFLLGLAGCAHDPGSAEDWTRDGRGMGEHLTQQGKERNESNCTDALRAYRADVGLPNDADNRRAMIRGCLGQS